MLLLLLQLLQWLLPWLLQVVIRRPKEDRGNVAAGDLGEGWQFYLVALLQPLGGLLWLLLLPWLLLRLLRRLVPRLLLLLWLALALRLVPWLWLLVLQLLLLWLLLSRGRWPWPLLPVGSGGEGVAGFFFALSRLAGFFAINCHRPLALSFILLR